MVITERATFTSIYIFQLQYAIYQQYIMESNNQEGRILLAICYVQNDYCYHRNINKANDMSRSDAGSVLILETSNNLKNESAGFKPPTLQNEV
ncbi:predicted protein [Sclerotinia sclerotiorum 1980 UF-70]|uniref:Uncharacterized protein n=1 Tax=Sclerotinia sclerotiorum (strain ATCC 18683 / 1980 / Ss-1) TaxID=665079 RepID=A7F8P9_SCLS1|nr:predicted protein [Sclerotinia sclerotiorum 1980 UF-70]EDN99120.1 predicted protein [Sclerotinia sclerotiorum 1980 UF-70]